MHTFLFQMLLSVYLIKFNPRLMVNTDLGWVMRELVIWVLAPEREGHREVIINKSRLNYCLTPRLHWLYELIIRAVNVKFTQIFFCTKHNRNTCIVHVIFSTVRETDDHLVLQNRNRDASKSAQTHKIKVSYLIFAYPPPVQVCPPLQKFQILLYGQITPS